MKKIVLIIREIINYFFILKQIKKFSKTKEWKELNLRSDWIGRIYTVINLRDDEVNEDKRVKWSILMEKLHPYNELIREMGIDEIVYPELKEINDYSYLIIYIPLFRKLRFIHILFFIGIIIGIIYLIKNYKILL